MLVVLPVRAAPIVFSVHSGLAGCGPNPAFRCPSAHLDTASERPSPSRREQGNPAHRAGSEIGAPKSAEFRGSVRMRPLSTASSEPA